MTAGPLREPRTRAVRATGAIAVTGGARWQRLSPLPGCCQYRHDAGLTLEQLSGNSGVSDRAISNMELGHSLGPQRKTVELIADALSLKGDNREALLFAAEAGRRRSYAPAPSVLAMPRGVTDFVGRAWEAGFLARLADAHHTGPAPVVVVSGTPGVGKTSFAVHAATELAANFPTARCSWI